MVISPLGSDLDSMGTPVSHSHKRNRGTFSILAVDGGGTRGIYPAQILARIEESTGQQVRDCFDLLAGTSTGSIVAGAASAGIPMVEVVGLFERESRVIFPKSRFPSLFSILFRSRYPRHPLEAVLQRCIPDIALKDVSTPLMITSADLATGGVHVFKTRYLGDLGEPYERDGNVLLKDAILASCAAPTYFDPKRVGSHLLVDGGLWANNPSILALTEAMSKFKMEVDQIKVFSVGTGHTANMYGNQRSWGLATGWGGHKLVSYTLGLQSQASTNMAKLILKERYLRLDPEIESWELDDTEHLGNLRALADRDFTYNSKVIRDQLRSETE